MCQHYLANRATLQRAEYFLNRTISQLHDPMVLQLSPLLAKSKRKYSQIIVLTQNARLQVRTLVTNQSLFTSMTFDSANWNLESDVLIERNDVCTIDFDRKVFATFFNGNNFAISCLVILMMNIGLPEPKFTNRSSTVLFELNRWNTWVFCVCLR